MKRKRSSGLLPIRLSTAAPVASVLDDLDPEQRALGRVHGRFLELAGQHLAEALEAADLDLAVAR